MSVHQKLIECEKSLNSPVDDIETHLDMRIGTMLKSLMRTSNGNIIANNNNITLNRNELITPPSSVANSEKSSVEIREESNNINGKTNNSNYNMSSFNNLGILATR